MRNSLIIIWYLWIYTIITIIKVCEELFHFGLHILFWAAKNDADENNISFSERVSKFNRNHSKNSAILLLALLCFCYSVSHMLLKRKFTNRWSIFIVQYLRLCGGRYFFLGWFFRYFENTMEEIQEVGNSCPSYTREGQERYKHFQSYLYLYH